MKKLISILLVAIMVFAVAGCNNNNGGGEQPKDDVKTYEVGVAIYKFDDNFMTLYRNEIESYFKTLETDTDFTL